MASLKWRCITNKSETKSNNENYHSHFKVNEHMGFVSASVQQKEPCSEGLMIQVTSNKIRFIKLPVTFVTIKIVLDSLKVACFTRY